MPQCETDPRYAESFQSIPSVSRLLHVDLMKKCHSNAQFLETCNQDVHAIHFGILAMQGTLKMALVRVMQLQLLYTQKSSRTSVRCCEWKSTCTAPRTRGSCIMQVPPRKVTNSGRANPFQIIRDPSRNSSTHRSA